MTMCGLVLGAVALFAQEDTRSPQAEARERADEARLKCAALVEGLEGVESIGMGGVGTDYRLLIVVRGIPAKQAAQKALGGDSFQGLKILWSVRSGVAAAPQAPAQNLPTVAAPSHPTMAQSVEPAGASVYDCDIIRDHLKLKAVSHPTGDGRSWTPCQILKRTVEGGAVNPPPVLYAKHRPDCPVYLGRVGQPPVADSFVAWVFQQGASVVTPEGTPQLSDLRPGVTPPPYTPPSYTTYPYYPYSWSYGWYRPYYYRHYSYSPRYYYGYRRYW